MSDRGPTGRFALAAALLTFAVAVLVAGCAQEGKLIETPLPVHAAAVDFRFGHIGPTGEFVVVDTTTHTRIGVTDTLNATFKISVHVKNACELQHVLLELRRVEPTNQTIFYEIIPVARYNADDKCVAQGGTEMDTVMTLNVNGLIAGWLSSSQTNQTFLFKILSAGAEPVPLLVDTLITVRGADSLGFAIKVENSAAGAVRDATVALDRLGPGGTATPIDSLVTGDDGLAEFHVPGLPDTSSAPQLPYRVRVTSGATVRILNSPTWPARLQRREKIVVRI